MVYTTHKNWQIGDGLLLLYPHDRYIAPLKKIPKGCKPVIIQTMGKTYIIELLNYHPGNVCFYLLGVFYLFIRIYNHVEVDTIWDVRTYSRVRRDSLDILLQDYYKYVYYIIYISNMIYSIVIRYV